MATSGNPLRVSSVEDFAAAFTRMTEIPVIETSRLMLNRVFGGGPRDLDLRGMFFDGPLVIRVVGFDESPSVGDYYAVLLHEIGHATAAVEGLGRPTGKIRAADEEVIADSFALAMMERFGLVVPEWFRETAAAAETEPKSRMSRSRSAKMAAAGRDLAERAWMMTTSAPC